MSRHRTDRTMTRNSAGVTTDRYQTRTDGEIDAGWGDKMLKVRGLMPMVIVLLGASLYMSATLLIKGSEAPVRAIDLHMATDDNQHKALSNIMESNRLTFESEHRSIIENQKRIADSLDQQVFYLSKTERERTQYQIEMPDSLRKKLIERNSNSRRDP